MRIRVLRNPSREVAKTVAAEFDAFPTDGSESLREGQVREVDDKAAERLIKWDPPLAEATTDPVREVPTEGERAAMAAEDTEDRLRQFRTRQAQAFGGVPGASAPGTNRAAEPAPRTGTHVDPKHPKKAE